MTRQTLIWVAVGLIVLIAVSVVFGQAPAGGRGGRGGGGARGMMGAGMSIERWWAALCFEVGISQTQFGKLKPTFQWAYKERNAAIKKAMEKRDFEALGKTMATVNKTVEDRIPIVLTAQQKEAWKKWQANEEAMRQKMREGMRQGAGAGQGKAGTKQK